MARATPAEALPAVVSLAIDLAHEMAKRDPLRGAAMSSRIPPLPLLCRPARSRRVESCLHHRLMTHEAVTPAMSWVSLVCV